MKKTIFFCLLACLCALKSLYASHFIGVEMSYKHLGGCVYRLYHTTYMDCGGVGGNAYIPPNMNNPYPAPAINFTGVGCAGVASAVNWTIYSTTDVTNMCPSSLSSCYANGNPAISGVFEITYYTDLNFCNYACNAVIIAYSACCRSYLAISGAAGEGIYSELIIPMNNNNSSPRFVTPAITYIPTGQTSTFQQPAYDPDGDSLVYSFAPCLQASGMTVTYNPGYSPTAVLGAGWTCNINSQTGEVTFVPTTGTIAAGVLGIQVDEYRNGTWLGKINRDIQICVLNINPSLNLEPTATFSNITALGFQNPPSFLRTTAGYPISFDLTITDPDTAQLLAYTSNIATNFPTATLTAISNTNPMVLTFSWTADTSNTGESYPLVIDVFDNNCELNGHYYFLTTIKVDSAYFSVNITDAACTLPTGAIDVTVGGGLPPYSYLWSNGDTTEDLVNILTGPYSLSISDINGGSWLTDTFYVNSLGLSANINVTIPDCSIANGALGIDMFGGIAPYTYIWSNGMTGDSINNLSIGGYSVDAYDTQGCYFHTATMLNYSPLDSCFSHIEGTVYYDFNQNCVQDSGEVGISNVYINISPGGAMFTDMNGYYSFTVYDTGAYQLQGFFLNGFNPINNCLAPNVTLNSYISLLSIDSLHNDFPMFIQPDIEIHLTEGWYLAGSSHFGMLNCHNVNYPTANATVTYQHDPILQNPTFVPAPTVYNANTYTAIWNLTNFYPNSNQAIYMYGTTYFNAIMGNPVISYANITPILWDSIPSNNQDTIVSSVFVSYDPNFKEVSPQGQTIYGLIPTHTENLEYTIHFQNTGNWQATYVILRDTIDIAHLDITSTEIQITSHACAITVENDSILVFTFNNINLPDSNTNEPLSHGFVKYGIKLKPNLPLYSAIQNQASIYFDFNAPIITNATTNTLYDAMNLAVTTNINICPNDFVLATVTQGRSPYLFEWSNGVQSPNNLSGISQILANFPTGTHNVVVTDYYGFTDTQTFTLTILPIANATFTYNAAANVYTFQADSLNNMTYLWNFGNGQSSNATSDTAIYTQSGTYIITLICTDICGGIDTVSQTITLLVGIENSLFQQQVSLSPNPTAHITTLSFANAQKEAYTLIISDVNGKVISVFEGIKEDKIAINTDKMASGVYFWELIGNHFATGKLLIE